MKSRDLIDLLLLAAIWGSSFLFMRMVVPAFGPVALAPVALAFVRVGGAVVLAGSALVPGLLPRQPARVA